MSEEKHLASVTGLYSIDVSKKDYVLYITSKRLVAIHTKSDYLQSTGLFVGVAFGGIVGGVIGAVADYGISKGVNRLTKATPVNLPLNDLTSDGVDKILVNDKNSFALCHSEIKRVYLREGIVGGELTINTKKGTKVFSVEKNQVDTLQEALEKVEPLEDRFYI